MNWVMPQSAMLHSSFLEKAFYKVKGLMNTITSIWGFFSIQDEAGDTNWSHTHTHTHAQNT